MLDPLDPSDSLRSELDRFKLTLLVAMSCVGSQLSTSGRTRDAGDAAQSAALSVCEGAIVGVYDRAKGAVRSFAFGVVLNKLRTQNRGQKRYALHLERCRALGAGAPSGPVAATGFDTAVRRERESSIAAALERLSSAEATEVRRRFFSKQPGRVLPATATQKKLWASATRKLAGLLKPAAEDYFGGRYRGIKGPAARGARDRTCGPAFRPAAAAT